MQQWRGPPGPSRGPEGIGRRIGYRRPCSGTRRAFHQLYQTGAGFIGLDRDRTGGADQRFVFPHRQGAPGFQPGNGRALVAPVFRPDRLLQQRRQAPRSRGPGLRSRAAPVWRGGQARVRATSASNAPAISNKASGGFFRCCGEFRRTPSSRANPAGIGNKGWPGRTKAKSSSTSIDSWPRRLLRRLQRQTRHAPPARRPPRRPPAPLATRRAWLRLSLRAQSPRRAGKGHQRVNARK